jgi:peptide chain release factor 1
VRAVCVNWRSLVPFNLCDSRDSSPLVLHLRSRAPSPKLTHLAAAHDGLSPALLTRARSITEEHETLAKKVAAEYDTNSARRLGQLSATATALKEYDNARSAFKELQVLLKSSDKELRELAEEDVEPSREKIQQSSDALKTSLIPIHPFAHLPCLIEIRPGAGGDEAAIFAGDVFRMYQAYCSRIGLRTSTLKYETADEGAHVQEAILEVESPGAYGILRCEAGVHRVQRVPATESKGRTHTSAVSVLVLPSVPAEGSQDLGEKSFDDPDSDYYVDKKDVQTDVMRARGAGGQHVNTTDSAVRLTHGPTNTVVFCQDGRSQIANREKAWQVLRSRIAQMRREEREAEVIALRRGAGAGKVGRENKVRTYNWGQQRVSDHRSNFDLRNLDNVMEGGDGLERVMDSVRVWMAEQEVLGLVAEEEIKNKDANASK